ncbi:hypothetical protein [Nocardia sp. CA-145437]|uniref:hypothetical protein n=1 Tax=unclassified Nocardia TaxID=2637762 RepID=UPI003D95E3AF
MKSGLVTISHVLAYCTECGIGWHCGAVDCEREACCLGDSDDAAAARLDAAGWEVDLTAHQFRCRNCAVFGTCDACGHGFGGGGVTCGDVCEALLRDRDQS